MGPMNYFLHFVLSLGILQAQFISSPEIFSVKTMKANVHESPSNASPVLWHLWKFMPVKVIAYKEEWVKFSDLDGEEGWVHKSVLSEVPTVMVKVKEAQLHKSPGGPVVWILDRGYSLRVFASDGEWLEVSDLGSSSGWVHRGSVWGAR